MVRALGSKYVLDEVLGRGATGEVWRGRSHEGGDFAFKILHDSLSRDPETVQRFLQEGRILTKVRHPGVVRVHDLVAEGETLAIVMDLIRGGDLRRLLEQQRVLAPGWACALAAEVANGLAAIHAAEVIHRDVKPENVLLDERTNPPSVRLTDFGIARIAEQTGSSATKMVGTPAYIAPELANGQSATEASDMYALGIMLYELCCGVTPFADESVLQTLQKHGHNAPGRPEGIPDPLWELIEALLAKDPAARPPSASGVAMALAAMAQDFSQIPPAPTLSQPPPSIPLVHGQLTENAIPPGSGGPRATGVPGTPERRRRRGRTVLIAAGSTVALAVVLGAVVLALRPTNNPTNPSTPGAATPGVAQPGTPTGPASVRPSYGPDKLPDLIGLNELDARNRLPATVGVQIVHQKAPEGTPDGVVLAQDPQPGSDMPTTLQLTVASRQATVYLADLAPASGDELTTGSEAADYKLSGHTQLHALGVGGNPCGSETGTAEYDLGQHYTKLIGLAGLDDNSPAAKTQVTLEIFGDQRKLKTITTGLGRPKPIDVGVTGVLRLTLRWEFTGGDASLCDGGTLVLGNAQLVAAAGYVPQPTAQPTFTE